MTTLYVLLAVWLIQIVAFVLLYAGESRRESKR